MKKTIKTQKNQVSEKHINRYPTHILEKYSFLKNQHTKNGAEPLISKLKGFPLI